MEKVFPAIVETIVKKDINSKHYKKKGKEKYNIPKPCLGWVQCIRSVIIQPASVTYQHSIAIIPIDNC